MVGIRHSELRTVLYAKIYMHRCCRGLRVRRLDIMLVFWGEDENKETNRKMLIRNLNDLGSIRY